jgi:hypothetical protein
MSYIHSRNNQTSPNKRGLLFCPLGEIGRHVGFKPQSSGESSSLSGDTCGCDVMVAMRVLETRVERRGGSSPFIRTMESSTAACQPVLKTGMRLKGRGIDISTLRRRFDNYYYLCIEPI